MQTFPLKKMMPMIIWLYIMVGQEREHKIILRWPPTLCFTVGGDIE